MKWFQIELLTGDGMFSVYLVKAKSYGEGCKTLADYHGTPNAFKLLGEYEVSELDKKMMKRIA